MIKNVMIKFLDKEDMRWYNTNSFDADDYYVDGDTLVIEIVSNNMSLNERFLLSIHAFVEAMLLCSKNVKLPDKSSDIDYVPHECHSVAEAMERILASLMNVDWVDYNVKIDKNLE